MKKNLDNRGSPTNPYGWVKWLLWAKFKIAVGWPGCTGSINGARYRSNFRNLPTYQDLRELKSVWDNTIMPSYVMVNYQVSLFEKDTIIPLGVIGIEDDTLKIFLRDFTFLFSEVGNLSQRLLDHHKIQIIAFIKSQIARKENPFAIYRRLGEQYRWNFFVSPMVISKKPLNIVVAERVPEAELIEEFEVKK